MPVLDVTKTYSDGNVLTEAMLDAMATSIETFCNTTKLDATNLQDGDKPSDKGNYAISASVAANALTIALKTKANTDPSATDKVRISFRSATATSGLFNKREVTGALSLVISSGSTLGHASATDEHVYVYALDNAGTVELAASSVLFDEGSVQSTTAEGGAGAADTRATLYSTTARTNVPIRLIGRLKSQQATAGTWATAIAEISSVFDKNEKPGVGYVISSSTGNSQDITNTSLTDIPNLTVTLQTRGGLIELALQHDGSSNTAFFGAGASANVAIVTYRFTQDGNGLGTSQIGTDATITGTQYFTPPSQRIVLAAGSYNFKFQAARNASSDGSKSYCRNLVLVAREIAKD